jgi:hypothetical protein
VKKKLLWISFIIPLILSVLSVNTIGVGATETPDIAVVSVKPSLTRVAAGELVHITVVTKNEGTTTETFNVTAHYDNATIGELPVTDLAPGNRTILIFAWNTTGVPVGTYNIKATASSVLGETDIADNVLISDDTVTIMPLYIAVVPQSVIDLNLTKGKSFTVSIYTDYDGSDIWGYEFTLTYHPLVLHGVEVVNGDLIKEDGGTVEFNEGEFDNTAGTLSLTGSFAWDTTTFPPVPVASTGPGVLANVTFTIVGKGESPITLGSETILMRGDGTNIIDDLTDLNPDPAKGKFLHGSFQNVREVIHDVAVTSIDPYPTSVEEGELVTINVTIRNKGTTTARVRVEVYYGFDPTTGIPLNLIEKETVILESGVNETLTFTWNTTNVIVGTYPIVAVAELLGGVTDINPDDNMLLIDDAVEVTALRGKPWPIWQIVSIIAVIIAIIVAIYIVRRKRRK